jgi:hypothetical protein
MVPRVMRSPSRPTNSGASPASAKDLVRSMIWWSEALCPAVEVVLDDRYQVGLDRNASVLAAFSADMNDSAATGGGADITNVGLAQFVGACRSGRRAAMGRPLWRRSDGAAFGFAKAKALRAR